MPASPRLTPALCGLLLAATSAQAQVYNVSDRVRGTLDPLPLVSIQPQQDCTTACSYAMASVAGISNAYTPLASPLRTNAWPPQFGTKVPAVPTATSELATAPADPGAVLSTGSLGAKQGASVAFAAPNFPPGARGLSVQTWRTGSGSAVLSYAIRLSLPAGAPIKGTYLEFALPQVSRGLSFPVNGSPDGLSTTVVHPLHSQSRSAVDVYADGLPLWSSESNRMLPRIFNPYNTFDTIDLEWGLPMDGSRATLYLGRLGGGFETTLTLILRTDSRVEADACGFQQSAGVTLQTCTTLLEALSIPAVSSDLLAPARPDVRLYTR